MPADCVGLEAVRIGEDVSERLDVIPARFRVIVTRAPIWLGRFARRPRLTRSISTLSRLVWWLAAGLPFHALAATKLMVAMRRVDRAHIGLLKDASTVGLALSRRAMDVVAPPHILAPPIWIIPPWVEPPAGASRQVQVSLIALLSYRDIANAVWLATRFTWAYGVDRRRRSWILQTYTAVPWLLSRIALARLDSDFIIAEHFDRWAVLADVAIRAARRSGNPARSMTLVQHGTVGSLDKGTGRVQLSYRLAAVKTLYVYDDASEAVFRNEILSDKRADGVEIHHFRPRIELTPTTSVGKTRILFVGHPLCADLQITVLEGLASQDVVAYYKPHPIAGLPGKCEGLRWEIIMDRDQFPEVDLLVAYRSTLVMEYNQHNIDAVLHTLSNDISEAAEILREIKSKTGSAP